MNLSHPRRDCSHLINFTCTVVKDELEKHPEMRTIAMVELKNNFPSEFSAKVLKCLPPDVAKIIINPHMHVYKNNTVRLPKESMVIYVADEVKSLSMQYFFFAKNFLTLHHLSKHLIVSSNKRIQSSEIFKKFLNVIHIYEENQKIIVNDFKNLINGNLSQTLFNDRAKNLNKLQLHAAFAASPDAHLYRGSTRPNCRWNYFLDIVADKLNATLKFIEIHANTESGQAYRNDRRRLIMKLIQDQKLDFYLNYGSEKFDLESYTYKDWCILAPLPKPISITDQILFLPLDKSCWMWLSITIAVSTFVWRISEGHWNFIFGAFAHFLGQSVSIQTSRIILKILLQILILTFFIFSNGYQSLVTSFMLNPARQKLLKSFDEVLDSDLLIHPSLLFMEPNNSKIQRAIDDDRVVDVELIPENWPKIMVEKNMAIAESCSIAKNRIENQSDGKSWLGLYLINDVVFSVSEDLFTRPFHPLLDRFQQIMDQTFEAGLHQAWDRFFKEILNSEYTRLKGIDQKTVLDFEAIIPFFLILVVGYVAAFLGLWCEIFFHDFVSELTWEYFKRKFDKIFRREVNVDKVKT